jgi:hypothetical protein
VSVVKLVSPQNYSILRRCTEALGRRFCGIAKLVFGMNQSLDGYVGHLEMRPSPALFRHFMEQVRNLTGSVYGRPCMR